MIDLALVRREVVDIITLTSFLSPFLPALVKIGTKAAETVATNAAKEFGEAAWKKAEAVWEKVRPGLEAKAAGKEAIEDLECEPEDQDNVAALETQLKKILKGDENLAAAIAEILEADAPDGTPGIQIVQNVTGDRNLTIGQMTGGKVFGNIDGSVTINE